MKQFKCHIVQLALFLKDSKIQLDDLSSKLRSKLAIGDFNTMIMPEAPGMPEDFPRLQITTPVGYRLTSSKTRIDFFIDLPLGIEDKDFNGFKANCSKLLEVLAELGCKYMRLGYVKTYFSSDEEPVKTFIDKVTRIPSDGLSDVQFNVTRKREKEGCAYNDIFSFTTAYLNMRRGLVAVRDLNTDAGIELVGDVQRLISNFDEASSVESIDAFLEGR
ncbi:hypothetical protein [Pseudomonas sp. PGPR81]|uniref:hypothetical protein n=1 Tax=Pseudomonas sp. PGPR81 TaxID=2913477 RepID=UPI001EDB64FE|nr:hypothetical protein [Pseudomonas sp. PGPR81]